MRFIVNVQVRDYCHQGLKRKCKFVCRYVAPSGECYYNTVLCCDYLFHRRVWYRTLCLRCACIRSLGIILIS